MIHLVRRDLRLVQYWLLCWTEMLGTSPCRSAIWLVDSGPSSVIGWFEGAKTQQKQKSAVKLLCLGQYWQNCCHDPKGLRLSAHMQLVFLQNFVKSSLGRRFTKDLRFCGQLLQKIKVNIIAGEGRTWKRGSKSNPLLCNLLRQIQFLNFKIFTSQEACCLSYQLFKYKPNLTKFCTDAKTVSANSLIN